MELFARATQAVLDLDAEEAQKIANEGIASGIDPLTLMTGGFVPGIVKFGDMFERGKVFLPELMAASEVMEKVTSIINGAINDGDQQKIGKAVLATVKGDVHDIGKSIVVSLFKANGIEVYDLGRDISADTIIAKAEAVGADIIGTSALLTTTMQEQKAIEEKLKASGTKGNYITVIGGAPVTDRWAKRIGADIYAENAVDGVNKVMTLLRERKNLAVQ